MSPWVALAMCIGVFLFLFGMSVTLWFDRQRRKASPPQRTSPVRFR